MDFTTLDSGFRKKTIVDQFSSAIWTERYSAPGDVVLVVEPSAANIALLAEGTFLSLQGSQEVMLLDTQVIENGLLKVTGFSLLEFLQERSIFPDTSNTGEQARRAWLVSNMVPGVILGHIITSKVFGGNGIPNLTLGPIDASGAAITIGVPYGSVLDGMKPTAEAFQLGMSLYLESATDTGYSLKFKSYKGIDRGSSVRFSPAMDSLTNVKELRSIQGC